MDAALTNPTGRKFPSYTTDELKIAVVDYQMGLSHPASGMTEAKARDMIEEVRRRQSGQSRTLHQVFGR